MVSIQLWLLALVLPSCQRPADEIDIRIQRLRGGSQTECEWAAQALGGIADPRAVEPLVASLKDNYASVRTDAAGALGKIRDPRAVEPLVACLKDSSWSVRESAAQALGSIGDPRAAQSLV